MNYEQAIAVNEKLAKISTSLEDIRLLLEVQARISLLELNARTNPGATGLRTITYEQILAEATENVDKEN